MSAAITNGIYRFVNLRNSLSVSISVLVGLMIKSVETGTIITENAIFLLLLLFAFYAIICASEWVPEVANWIVKQKKGSAGDK